MIPLAIPTALIALASLLGIWIVRVVRYRKSFKALVRALPSPSHSPRLTKTAWTPQSTSVQHVVGTIPALAELYKTSPRDTHPMTTMTLLYQKYQLGALYFLDNWPVAEV